MVTWEQVCWLGSPVGRQGCGSEIEILRPLFQNLLYFLQNSRLLGTFQPWKNQTICEQTLEPVFFPERVYHTKSWELTLVFSCQCLVTTVAFQEHRKSLPICPLFSSLLLQHQIDWLRLLVGPCGHGALHEPLLQAELRLAQGPRETPPTMGPPPPPGSVWSARVPAASSSSTVQISFGQIIGKGPQGTGDLWEIRAGMLGGKLCFRHSAALTLEEFSPEADSRQAGVCGEPSAWPSPSKPSSTNHMLVTQSCLSLCDPPGSSVHGIPQARILGWVAHPFSRGSSQPRCWTLVSCIAGRFFTIRAPREAHTLYNGSYNFCIHKIPNP